MRRRFKPNIKRREFRKEDKTEIEAENIPVITIPNPNPFEEETQKNLHVSPKISIKNLNTSHIVVGDEVLFAERVGLEAGVYVAFTDEVSQIVKWRKS